ncbi:MAG: ABC transporter permease [Myxococcota bacterium]|nr:ABC transporter permease [Myxococcota bacterium]
MGRSAASCGRGILGRVTQPVSTASADPALRIERTRDGVRFVVRGRLDVDVTGAHWDAAMRAARAAGGSVTVDTRELTYCDGAGAALLGALERSARESGARFAIEGLRDDVAKVVALVRPGEREPEPPAARPGFVTRVGRASLDVWASLRAQVAFLGELVAMLVYTARRPRTLRFRDAIVIAERAGIGAVPIVLLVGFLLGLILAFQGAIPMQRFGAQIFVADLLGISMLRELGALMAAILLTARSGSAFAAEIGTMKLNEEIDALSTMGLEPVRFLVVPRVLAAVAVVPALTLLTNFAALLGGLLVFVQLGFPAVTFVNRVLASVTLTDFATGMGKAVVFGVLVAAVGCLRGIQTGTDAQAVGAATTSAVVSGIVLIAVTDGIFAVVFYVLGI